MFTFSAATGVIPYLLMTGTRDEVATGHLILGNGPKSKERHTFGLVRVTSVLHLNRQGDADVVPQLQFLALSNRRPDGHDVATILRKE